MPLTVPRPIAAAVLGGLLLGASPVRAADLDEQPYPGPEPLTRVEEEGPPAPPRFAHPPLDEPRYVAGPRFAPPPGEACRLIVKRRIDEDGAEIVRRVRVCEEEIGPGPRFRPSYYGPRPVPPADVPDGPWSGPPRW